MPRPLKKNKTEELPLCQDCFLSRETSVRIVREQEPRHLCDFCFQEYRICINCANSFRNCSTLYSGEIICPSCISRYYRTCYTCGMYFLTSEMEVIAPRAYCRSHAPTPNRTASASTPRAPVEDVLHSYTYKPRPIFMPFWNDMNGSPKQGTLYMGVELEVDRVNNMDASLKDTVQKLNDIFNLGDLPELVYFKRDGSLQAGIEMVSQPCTLDYHKDTIKWEESFKWLVKRGYRSHDIDTCGLHVHVDKSFMTETERMRLGIFIHGNPKYMNIFARRNASRYAKFKEIKMDTRQTRVEAYNSRDRYEALNWLPAKTVEFRLFKGTLNYDSFIGTLEFVDAVIRFVKTVGTATVSSETKGWMEFQAYIKDNNYHHLKNMMDTLHLWQDDIIKVELITI